MIILFFQLNIFHLFVIQKKINSQYFHIDFPYHKIILNIIHYYHSFLILNFYKHQRKKLIPFQFLFQFKNAHLAQLMEEITLINLIPIQSHYCLHLLNYQM